VARKVDGSNLRSRKVEGVAKEVRQIALYGKGGIGKSTVACNISVALTEMGHKVIQVGCSPKADSVIFLNRGNPLQTTILDYYREKGVNEDTILDSIEEGYKGILIAEAGGPEPAEGCAGRGTAVALDFLSKYNVFERLGIDFAIYDVIGDVVCGGFAIPMRTGYAKEIYLVSSGELMSLYSSNNICSAIATLKQKGVDVGVAGIINNMRGVEKEIECMEEFSKKIGVRVIANIPRSDIFQAAEEKGGTIVGVFPDSEEAQIYRRLTQSILDNRERVMPTPMELGDIMDILRKYQALD